MLARSASLLGEAADALAAMADQAWDDSAVQAGATVTVVKLADVVRMERSGDGLEPSPVFEIELASGDKIDGVLQESDLQVQAGNHLLRVPVQHFIAARSSGARSGLTRAAPTN